MVVCFAGVLAGTALVFDVFFLTAGAGLALAALYTVPLLAGLVACLIAAAEDLGLDRPVLSWTVAATIAFGLANIAVVATVGAMRRTGPSDWRHGGEAVLLSAATVSCFAVVVVVMGNLAHSLGVVVKTRFPEKRRAPDVVRWPAPRRTAPAPNKPATIELARSKPALSTQGRVKPVSGRSRSPRSLTASNFLCSGSWISPSRGRWSCQVMRPAMRIGEPPELCVVWLSRPHRRHLRPGRPQAPGATARAATSKGDRSGASVVGLLVRSHALSRR